MLKTDYRCIHLPSNTTPRPALEIRTVQLLDNVLAACCNEHNFWGKVPLHMQFWHHFVDVCKQPIIGKPKLCTYRRFPKRNVNKCTEGGHGSETKWYWTIRRSWSFELYSFMDSLHHFFIFIFCCIWLRSVQMILDVTTEFPHDFQKTC